MANFAIMCYRCDNCSTLTPPSTEDKPQPCLTFTEYKIVSYPAYDPVTRDVVNKTRRDIRRVWKLCDFCHAGASKGIPLSSLKRQRTDGGILVNPVSTATSTMAIAAHKTEKAFEPIIPPLELLGQKVQEVVRSKVKQPAKQPGPPQAPSVPAKVSTIKVDAKQPVKVVRKPKLLRQATAGTVKNGKAV